MGSDIHLTNSLALLSLSSFSDSRILRLQFVMASDAPRSSGKQNKPSSSGSSYFPPLSDVECIALHNEITALKTSNPSTYFVKILPFWKLDLLLRRDEYSPDKLFFPLDALKFCPLPFPQILVDFFSFTHLAPCQVSP